MGLAPPPPRASACWKISSGASCLIITMFLAGERREAVGEGAISGLFGNRSAAMGLGPGGRLDSLSFTGRRGCVLLLDAEYFCSFSYIRGLDP